MSKQRRSQSPDRRTADPAAFSPRPRAAALAIGAAFAASALANPAGPTVVSGGATFAASGNTLNVTNTPGAIINWQQFSIQKNEITRFIQQHAASSVLNRVTGTAAGIDPSVILGTLTSNGRVFLINPSGIVFGAGAVIDVPGFAASTLNISDSDWIAGRLRFAGTGQEGKIANAGTIRTGEGGFVYLIAPQVENQAGAVVTSPKGEIVIAAGRTVELVNSLTPDLRVEFTAPDNQALNAGDVVAASGRVGIYGTLIRNSGLVSASRAEVGEGGRIVLKAVKDVTLDATSRLEASGARGGAITVKGETGTLLAQGVIEAKGEEAKGGEIQLLAKNVGLIGSATVDASGERGGGTVLVGGDYQGKNLQVPNAERTYAGRDVVVRADAGSEGDGGKIVFWADDWTKFYGSASARGGAAAGNGGLVEVSGKRTLHFDGRVDTRAPNGNPGLLLLDPDAITIVNGSGGGNDSLLGATDGTVNFGDDGTGSITLSETALEAVQSTTNVLLQANVSITIDDLSDNTLGLQQGSGNSVTFQTGAGGTFTMNTGDTIRTGGGSVAITSGAITAGGIQTNNGAPATGGAVTLTATSGAGTVQVGAIGTNGATNGGAVQITANNGVTLNGAINAGNATVSVSANQDGAGAQGITQGASASITTTNATAIAVALNANTAGGGTGTISLGADITAGAGGTITVDTSAAGGNTTGGAITRTGGALSSGGAGSVVLRTGGSGAAIGATGAPVTFAAGQGGVAATANNGGVHLAGNGALSLGAITTGGGLVDVRAAGSLTVGGSISSSNGAITLESTAGSIVFGASGTANAGTSTVTLTAGDQIQGDGASLTNVVGSALTATAVNGIGTGSPLETQVASIAASNNTSGGISISNTGNLSFDGSGGVNGALSLTTTGTFATAADIDGIRGATTIDITSGGDMTIGHNLIGSDAVTLTVNTADKTLNVGGGITVNNTGGSGITLVADRMSIAGDVGTTSDANTIEVRPFSASRTIDLGGADSATTLGLSAGELDLLKTTGAGLVRIGGAAFSGDISVTAAIAPANTSTLSLWTTAGTISQGAGDTITETNLALRSGGAVTLTESNAVVNLAADVSGSGNALSFTDSDGLNVGASIDGLSGIATTNGAVTLVANGAISDSAGATIVTGSGKLTTNSAGGTVLDAGHQVGQFQATNSGSGDVQLVNTAATLDVQGVSQAGTGAINLSNTGNLSTSGAVTTTGSGAITLSATDALTLGAALGSGTAGDVTLNANTAGADAAGFTQSGGSSITTGSTGAGAVAINVNSAANGTGGAALRDVTTGAGGTITVTTGAGGGTGGGSITQTAGTLLSTGATGTVSLATGASTSGIGASGAPVLTTTGTLTATTGSGGLFVTETDAVVLGPITSAGSAAISAGGSITTAGVIALNGGSSTITATGGGDLTISHDISRATGSDGTLVLRAHGSVILNDGVDIAQAAGNTLDVTLNSDFDGTGAGRIVVGGGTTAATITTQGGNIVLGGGNVDPELNPAIGTGAAAAASGVYLNKATLAAGGGNVSIRGQGNTDAGGLNNGVTMLGGSSITTSGTGAIFIKGTGGAAGNSNNGVNLSGTIQTADGGITIEGTGGSALAGNHGFVIENGGVVKSIGSGNILITGTAGAGGSAIIGIGPATNTIGSGTMTGTITLDANAGAVDLSLADVVTASSSGSAAVVKDAGSVTLGNVTATNGTLVLGDNLVTPNIAGAVTQAASTVLDVGTVTASTSDAITLDQANTIANLGTIRRGGALTVNDTTGGLTLTGGITTGTTTNAVSITTDGGALAIGANGITGNQISLQGVGVTQAAGSTLDAGAGTISVIGGNGAVSLLGTLATTNDTAAAVSIQNSGAFDVTVGQINTGTSTAGQITVTAGRDILDDGSDATALKAKALSLLAGRHVGAATGAGAIPADFLDIDASSAPTIGLTIAVGGNLYLNFVNATAPVASSGITFLPAGLANIGIGVTGQAFNFDDETFGSALNSYNLSVYGTSIALNSDVVSGAYEIRTSGTVSLTATTGAITDSGDTNTALDITAGSLTLSAKTGIGSANQIETDTATLTASNTGASGNVSISNAQSLNLGGGSSVTNSASGGGITLAVTGATNDLTISSTVSGTGNAAIDLSAGQDIVFAQAATGVTTGAATVTLSAGRDIVGSGAGPDVVSTGATSLVATAAGEIGKTKALATDTTGTLSLTSDAAGAAGNIAVVEANALALSRVTLAGTGTGTGRTVSLTSTAGPITVDANRGDAGDNLSLAASAQNILRSGNFTLTANALTLDAQTGIGSAATPIQSAAATISANNAVSGDVALTNAGSVTVSGSNAGGGVFNATLTGPGDTLTIGAGGIDANTGDVTLRADALNITAPVTVAGNNVTLRPNDTSAIIGVEDLARTFNVTNAMLDQVTAAGTITIGGAGHTGNISAAGNASIAQGTKDLALVTTGAGAIALTGASGNDVTANDLTLSAGSGGITSAGTMRLNANGVLTLTSAGGIGASGLNNAIEIGTATGGISATNTSAGDIYLATDGDITLGGATTSIDNQVSGGTISVASGGNISIAGDVTVSGGGASTVSLSANGTILNSGAGGTIGAATVSLGSAATTDIGETGGNGPLQTAAGTLNITQGGGPGEVNISNTFVGTANVATLTVDAANDASVTIVSSDSLSVPGLTGSGAQTYEATAGALTVGGALSVDAGGISLTGGTGISLSNGLTTAGGSILVNSSATVSGGGTVQFDAGAGSIQTANLTIGDGTTLVLTTTGAGTVDTGAISGTSGGTAASSHLTIDAGGAVTVAGSVGTDFGTLTVANSAGADFQSTVSVNALAIQDTAAGQTVQFGGNLTVGAGGMTVAGTANNYNVSLLGAANTVGGAAVAFQNTGDVTLVAGGGVSTFTNGVSTDTGPANTNVGGTVRTNGAALALGDTALTANSTLDATNNGGVGTGGDVSVGVLSGAFSLTANAGTQGSFTLGQATAGLVNLQAAGDQMTLGQISASGDVLLVNHHASAAIDLTNDISATNVTLNSAGGGGFSESTGTIAATGLKVRGSGTFVLDQGNAIVTLAGNVSGGSSVLSYTDADGFAIGSLSTVETLGGTANNVNGLTVGTASTGRVTLTNGATTPTQVTQSQPITTGSLQLLGSGGYDLSNAGNAVATLAANLAGGDLTFVRAAGAALTVGSVDGTATGGVLTNGITTTAGNVTLTAATGINLAQDIATSGGDITLNSNATASGATRNLDAGAGSIQTANLTIGDGTTLVLTTTGAGTVDTGAISGTSGGTAASSHLTIDAGGAVTVAGSVGTDFGTLTVANSAGADFQSTVSVNALAIQDTAAGQTVQFGGNLTVGAGGMTVAGTANNYNVSLLGAANTVGGAAVAFQNTGDVTLVAGGGVSTFTNGVSTDTGPANTNVGGTVRTNGAALALGDTALTANSTLDATNNGGVGTGGDVSVGVLSGAFSLTANAGTQGSFTLGQATAGLVNLQAAGDQMTLGQISASGDVLLVNHHASAAIDLTNDISATNVTLNSAGGGGFSESTGTIAATGLKVRGSGTFVLDQGNAIVTLAGNVSGGSSVLSYTDADGFAIGSLSTVETLGGTANNVNGLTVGTASTGRVTLTNGATTPTQVTQSQPITTGSLQLLGSGGYDLSNAGNAVATLAANMNGVLIYADSDALTVGSVNGTNGITTADNDVVLSTGALTLSQDVNAGAGDVRLVSSGTITQTGGAVTAANLGMRAAGTIDVNSATNNVATLAATTSAGTITYQDADALTVGTVTALGAFTPAVTGVSTTGTGTDITLTTGDLLTIGSGAGQDIVAANAGTVDLNAIAGGVTEATGSIVSAGSLRLQGTGTFTLTEANAVTTLAANVTGTLSYTDTNTLTIGSVNGTDGINTNGNDLTVLTGGLLTLGTGAGQGITATGATVDLNAAGLTENTGSIIAAGSLRLRGTGTFLLEQANDVDTIAAAVDGVLRYTDANVLTVGSVLGTDATTTNGINTTGDDLVLSSGSLDLNQDVTASGATVRIISSGTITQTGGAITANALGMRAAGTIDVNSATNNAGTLAATTSAGTITYQDADVLTVGTVSASGAFTATTGVSTTGTGTDITLTTGNTITVSQPISALGRVTLDTTLGGVSATGAASQVTANELLLLGTGTYTFTPSAGTNAVGTLAADVTGDVSFTQTGALEVGAVGTTNGVTTANNDVVLSTGALTLSQDVNAGAGDVRLVSSGTITQTGGAVTAANLGMRAAGTIDVNSATNNVATLAATTSAGTITYQDADALTVGTVTALGAFTPAVTGVSTTGTGTDITLTTGDLLTIGSGAGQDIVAANAGTVDLNAIAGGVTEATGSIVSAGSLRLQGTGTFTLTEANAVTTLAANVTGTLSYTDTNTLTIGSVNGTDGINTNGNDLTVLTGGLLTLGTGAGQGITATGATVDLNAAGLTENTGSIIAAGSLRLRGTGTFLLEQANDVDTIAAAVTGSLSFTDADDLSVGTVTTAGITTTTGSLTLTTGDTLDINNTIVTTGGGTVTLTNGNTLGIAATGTINADGAVLQNGAGDVLTAGNITTTNDNVTFSSAVTLTGPVTINAGSGGIFFDNTLDGGQALVLNSTGTTRFAMAVGGGTPLASLTTNALGTTQVNGGLVQTSGNQTYNDPVTLGADASLAAGGNININAGIAGATRTLALDTGGAGDVNATTANVSTLNLQNIGGTAFFTDTVTVGTLNVPASVNNVSMTGTGNTVANAVDFQNSGDLTLGRAGGTQTFNGGLTTSAGGTVTLLGTVATSNDAILFNGPVSLGAATTVTTGAGGTADVTFASTLDGTQALAVNTGGTTTFGGAVGGTTPLASLSTDAAGTTAVDGGLVRTNNGSVSFADPVTLGSGGATVFDSGTSGTNAIAFGSTLTGDGNAVTFLAGATGDLTVTGALTGVSDLDVTARDVSIVNAGNAITGTASFASARNVNYLESDAISLGTSTLTGSAVVRSATGGISTGAGLFSAANGITLVANDTSAGLNDGQITIGPGGLSTTNSAVLLHAADDIAVNGPITSGGGNIEFIAGNAPGLITAAITLPATETTPDNFGAITFNQPVNAGSGEIMVVSAGDANPTASQSDVTQSASGGLRSSTLTVVTLKGPGGLGNPGASILLDSAIPPATTTALGNANANVRLLTCAADGCPTPVPSGPTPPVNTSASNYSAGQILYSDTAGVNLQGVGTVSDFYTFVTGNFTLTANPFSATSITIEAGGDITIDLAQNLFKTSDNRANSLNFVSGGDILYAPTSYTIGTPAQPFDNVLNLTAVGDVTLENSLYIRTQNLGLHAGATINTPFQGTVAGDPAGSVTLRGNYTVQTGGNVTVTGNNFSLLGGATGGVSPNSPMSVNGQSLVAGGTISLLNNGVVTVQAGTATSDSASGARMTAGTIRVGQAGMPASSTPVRLVVAGGTNSMGFATSNDTDPRIDSRQANAVIEALEDMFVYLRKDAAVANPMGQPHLDPMGRPYSLQILGGSSSAINTGSTPLYVSALGALRADRMEITSDGSILLQGGTSSLQSRNAISAASAVLLAGTRKTITTNGQGSVVLRGGTASASSSLTLTEAAGAQALAELDPSLLTMDVAGNLILHAGRATGAAGPVASARIDAGDEIRITVRAPSSMTYSFTDSTGASRVASGGVILVGDAPGTGTFDAGLVPLDAGGVPGGFPVTIALPGGGAYSKITDVGLADSVIQVGRNVFDQSLLNYVIFAANEETRTARIRRGIGSDEDLGAPACQ